MYVFGAHVFLRRPRDPPWSNVQQLRKTLNHKDSFKDGQALPAACFSLPPPRRLKQMINVMTSARAGSFTTRPQNDGFKQEDADGISRTPRHPPVLLYGFSSSESERERERDRKIVLLDAPHFSHSHKTR
jgi:hypothetical protein